VSRWRRREPEWPLPGLAPDPSLGEPADPAVGPSTPSGVSSAHRPAPAANAWPDDAVLLTYGELRRLIALHLTLCASTMPHDRPWGWMKALQLNGPSWEAMGCPEVVEVTIAPVSAAERAPGR
jgi:hypothetical protein